MDLIARATVSTATADAAQAAAAVIAAGEAGNAGAVMDLEQPLAAYDLGGPSITKPLPGGLINLTFYIEAPRGRFVLQRLHSIFGPEVNEDIEVVTAHLAARGLVTPRLVRTRDGAFSTTLPDGVWRMMTYVDGTSVHEVDSPARAEAAGALVGRFHAALVDLKHDFRFRRAGVHDTARHFTLLDEAIDKHRMNAERSVVMTLRDELRAGLAALSSVANAQLPRRIAHGDLKISNVLFDSAGRAVCLVDLDTIAEMPLPYELGDAFRSWCNPLGESDVNARFDLSLFASAMRGYRGEMGSVMTPEERGLLVTGVLTICVELAARFARDVLESQYFGWDKHRYPSRAAHNLVRARSQAALYRSLLAQRVAAEKLAR
jgi:Ser/Thr protein kinase RdoA (MazF antagonist)